MDNKITLKMVSKDIGILQRNNQDLICPLVPPMTIRQRATTALGQVQEQVHIQKSSCNSNCPLFQINENKDNWMSATICCGGSPVVYDIEIIPQEQKEDDGKVIQM